MVNFWDKNANFLPFIQKWFYKMEYLEYREKNVSDFCLTLRKNMSSVAFLLHKLHKFLFKVVRHDIFSQTDPQKLCY